MFNTKYVVRDTPRRRWYIKKNTIHDVSGLFFGGESPLVDLFYLLLAPQTIFPDISVRGSITSSPLLLVVFLYTLIIFSAAAAAAAAAAACLLAVCAVPTHTRSAGRPLLPRLLLLRLCCCHWYILRTTLCCPLRKTIRPWLEGKKAVQQAAASCDWSGASQHRPGKVGVFFVQTPL